jgi:hypothetical protein
MRQVTLLTTRSPGENIDDWLNRALGEIEEASGIQPAEESADAIELINFDQELDIRTEFDVLNATLDELRQIVATLLFYIQKRGPERTQ